MMGKINVAIQSASVIESDEYLMALKMHKRA